MGLDITAYRQIVLVRPLAPNELPTEKERAFDRLHLLSPCHDFPDHADGVVRGLYSATETFDFRAGSYSGYNRWRNDLARAVGLEADQVWRDFDRWKEKPFAWLINFTDCEGVIGSTLSARLYDDFITHADRAKDHPELDSYEQYSNFTRAFAIASDGGAVEFH